MDSQEQIPEKIPEVKPEEKPPHSTGTRVFAFLGAVAMVGITVLIIYLLGGGTI